MKEQGERHPIVDMTQDKYFYADIDHHKNVYHSVEGSWKILILCIHWSCLFRTSESEASFLAPYDWRCHWMHQFRPLNSHFSDHRTSNYCYLWSKPSLLENLHIISERSMQLLIGWSTHYLQILDILFHHHQKLDFTNSTTYSSVQN